MGKDFVPLSKKINEATNKLKEAGYVVFNDNDDKFAILAERKKYVCKGHVEFFKLTLELTSKNNED